MNGTRMNQLVAPTNFITSISRRRANMAVRTVFKMSSAEAASSRAPNTVRPWLRKSLMPFSWRMTSVAAVTWKTPGCLR